MKSVFEKVNIQRIKEAANGMDANSDRKDSQYMKEAVTPMSKKRSSIKKKTIIVYEEEDE